MSNLTQSTTCQDFPQIVPQKGFSRPSHAVPGEHLPLGVHVPSRHCSIRSASQRHAPVEQDVFPGAVAETVREDGISDADGLVLQTLCPPVDGPCATPRPFVSKLYNVSSTISQEIETWPSAHALFDNSLRMEKLKSRPGAALGSQTSSEAEPVPQRSQPSPMNSASAPLSQTPSQICNLRVTRKRAHSPSSPASETKRRRTDSEEEARDDVVSTGSKNNEQTMSSPRRRSTSLAPRLLSPSDTGNMELFDIATEFNELYRTATVVKDLIPMLTEMTRLALLGKKMADELISLKSRNVGQENSQLPKAYKLQ
ncbi:hypothetical protein BDV23DRAFT_182515 [Aspergillus alliaceus]|uniref:Uncharacterized protein n=1 Tax=Petromyces alliaceus TaxID=209559 RepID=A0A5N7CC08_PETAA|nr:hypothetical protein BDV23DRAFT_182515 [Aspergillus alliaceus]